MGNWARKWLINDGPEHVQLPNGLHGRFELQLHDESAYDWYKTSYTGDDMDHAWRRSWFVERGNSVLDWNETPLKSWTPDQRAVYNAAIKRFLDRSSSDTQRLEGEIEVDGKKEAVTLVIAYGAVEGPKDLLIIGTRIHFLKELGVESTLQDGTGHAEPNR